MKSINRPLTLEESLSLQISASYYEQEILNGYRVISILVFSIIFLVCFYLLFWYFEGWLTKSLSVLGVLFSAYMLYAMTISRIADLRDYQKNIEQTERLIQKGTVSTTRYKSKRALYFSMLNGTIDIYIMEVGKKQSFVFVDKSAQYKGILPTTIFEQYEPDAAEILSRPIEPKGKRYLPETFIPEISFSAKFLMEYDGQVIPESANDVLKKLKDGLIVP